MAEEEKAETVPFHEEEEVEHRVPKEDKETQEDQRIRIRVLIIIVAILVLLGVAFVVGYVVRLVVHRCDSSVKESSTKTEELIQQAAKNISSSNIRSELRYFTKVPHVGGSEESKEQALYMQREWLKYGVDKAELKKYDILLSFPKKPGKASILDVNGTEIFHARQKEKILEKDEDDPRVLPPFNAYSASGTVTGALVYVNYARVEDFDKLKELGISVAGRIAIARYGKIFRGIKEKQARKAGAIGLILFSDPKDYSPGVSPNNTYPKTWWLPTTGVQRGSLFFRAGDPLTEGYPSIDGMYRSPINETGLPELPVYPVSSQDAMEFLKLLSASKAPDGWQGGLRMTYYIEMSPALKKNVSLDVEMELVTKPVYTVIGTIQGEVEPDRLVLFGNHRDAWIFGATDPSSGTASLMEVVRVIGNLKKDHGWRPRRTLVFLSWGAEEHGMLGSTEWVEDFTNLINNRAVAYLNVDVAVEGNYSIRLKSTPLLDYAMFEATKKVMSPKRSTMFDEWKSKFPDKSNSGYPVVKPISGSGSDYAAFYHRLGIPSVDFTYTYDKNTLEISSYPVYHSVHDTFHWMANFVDRGFAYHRAVSQLWVRIGLTLADSLLIPFNTSRYAETLNSHVENMKAAHKDAFNKQDIKLDYLDMAVVNFTAAANKFQQSLSSVDINDALAVRMLNDRLVHFEKSFVNPQGLPGRPFERHVIYAPSAHDSYSGSSFPGLVDALYEAKQNQNWNQVRKQLSLIVYYIRCATQLLSSQGM